MSEWKYCKNKPLIRHYREVRPDEHGVETLEGYKPCSPQVHFIMRGVNGEEYPIDKKILASFKWPPGRGDQGETRRNVRVGT